MEIGFSLVRARTEKSSPTSEGSASRKLSSMSSPVADSDAGVFDGGFKRLRTLNPAAFRAVYGNTIRRDDTHNEGCLRFGIGSTIVSALDSE